MPVTITITTANICGNPIRPKAIVRKRMNRALSNPGVTFGQECAAYNKFRIPPRGNYSRAWHRLAERHNKITEGGGHEVPISLDATFKIVNAESRFIHAGKKFVSPNRFATIVKTTIGGQKVAFVNCHTVSQPRLSVFFGKWRIANWNLYLNKLEQIISELHTEGFTTVFGGDMNAPLDAIPVVNPKEHLLISRGLDHLWVVPAEGVTCAIASKSVVPRTVLMDHPILTASFVLS